MAERARQRRRLAKISMVALAVVTLGAGAWYGRILLEERWSFEGLRPVAREPRSTEGKTFASAETRAPIVSPSAAADGDSVRHTLAADTSAPTSSLPVAEAAQPPAPVPSSPPLEPVIAEGRTELGDSLYAVREGDSVTVHFDTYLSRTRRRDKFDRIVRQTLPMVYGAPADSLLAHVPVGQIAQGDLVGELPSSGISFELADGSTLALWPRTRAGRDGPLVVAYRATITR